MFALFIMGLMLWDRPQKVMPVFAFHDLGHLKVRQEGTDPAEVSPVRDPGGCGHQSPVKCTWSRNQSAGQESERALCLVSWPSLPQRGSWSPLHAVGCAALRRGCSPWAWWGLAVHLEQGCP